MEYFTLLPEHSLPFALFLGICMYAAHFIWFLFRVDEAERYVAQPTPVAFDAAGVTSVDQAQALLKSVLVLHPATSTATIYVNNGVGDGLPFYTFHRPKGCTVFKFKHQDGRIRSIHYEDVTVYRQFSAALDRRFAFDAEIAKASHVAIIDTEGGIWAIVPRFKLKEQWLGNCVVGMVHDTFGRGMKLTNEGKKLVKLNPVGNANFAGEPCRMLRIDSCNPTARLRWNAAEDFPFRGFMYTPNLGFVELNDYKFLSVREIEQVAVESKFNFTYSETFYLDEDFKDVKCAVRVVRKDGKVWYFVPRSTAVEAKDLDGVFM